MNKALTIGLEVILALGAGIAMFFSVSEAVKRGKSANTGCNDCNNGTSPVNDKKAGNSSNTLINSFRAAQSTCSKLVALTQGLVTMAESIDSLSSNRDFYSQSYTPPYYRGGGGQRWRRVNDFIIESVPEGAPINYNNQYPI